MQQQLDDSQVYNQTLQDIITILDWWRNLTEEERQERTERLRPETYYNGGN